MNVIIPGVPPTDLRALYDIERVKDRIEKLHAVIESVHDPGEAPVPEVLAGLKLIAFLDLQLERLNGWLDGPNDLIALAVRNILETMIWARYVMKGPVEADRFLSEHSIDMKELAKCSGGPPSGFSKKADAAFAEIQKRLLNLEGSRVRLGREDDVEEFIYGSVAASMGETALDGGARWGAASPS